jgi:hypothetical protein
MVSLSRNTWSGLLRTPWSNISGTRCHIAPERLVNFSGIPSLGNKHITAMLTYSIYCKIRTHVKINFSAFAKILAKQSQGDNFAIFKTLIIRLLSHTGEITGDITTDEGEINHRLLFLHFRGQLSVYKAQ